MMPKDKLSFTDVERLLGELAQHDRRAEDAARAQRLRALAEDEVHRVFRRRRGLRLAGGAASLTLMAAALFLLPEGGGQGEAASAIGAKVSVRQMAQSKAGARDKAPAAPPAHAPIETCVSYEGSRGVQFEASCTGGYDIVVYPVPL